ncbi:HNH endonuclease [Cerasicoccus fimbriatus]|uniref:HNH endonuclease n=1 Tax=Cerasicoccus fimbriatus TaxID=3014554 RepID=UPI0022B2F740|nr:HNH endonuclease [Cerasicoccus sp. TK19100]
MPANTWTKPQLLVAMNLYTRLPFGLFHARQPEIVRVAELMGRSPGALAMKLCNLASLDPAHQARGVSGLSNASRGDREMWARFEQDWTGMALQSEEAFAALATEEAANSVREQASDFTGVTVASEVQRRVGQQFFRRAVLTAYDTQCCITGNPVGSLLTASHIQPWASAAQNRLNPRNGLCLAKTQDTAFDQGLITLDEDYRVVLSQALADHFSVQTIQDNFKRYEGQAIRKPSRFAPDPQFLAFHREQVFAA